MVTSLMHRLNTFLLVMLVLMAASIIAILASRAGAGPLDPPAPPAATLPQVEPRMPIPPPGWNGTFPINIGQSGSYFLTRSLTTAATGINITVSDVSIDLNGFTLRGAASPGYGIVTANGTSNILVENGTVSGFGLGVALGYTTRSRVENVNVSDNVSAGIQMGSGGVVSHVSAGGNGMGVTVSDPYSNYFGGLVEDSILTRNTYGVMVSANNVTLRRNVIESSKTNGAYITSAFVVFTDNTVQGTDSGDCISVAGTFNTIARNVLGHCSTGIAIGNSGNMNLIGPWTSDLNSSQPWSNAIHG